MTGDRSEIGDSRDVVDLPQPREKAAAIAIAIAIANATKQQNSKHQKQALISDL
jgi:hypothetical protein